MIKKAFFSIALLALTSQAQAATLNVDGVWNTFDVDSSLSNSGNLEWIALDGSPLSFDFTLSQSAYLRVVDGGFAGDRFQIFDNGNTLGTTSNTTNNYPNSIGLDFDLALADSSYSQGIYLLSAGQHSITGLLSLSALDDSNPPINATVGAVSLTSVPLPAAAWLYATGAALIGAVSRRRSANV